MMLKDDADDEDVLDVVDATRPATKHDMESSQHLVNNKLIDVMYKIYLCQCQEEYPSCVIPLWLFPVHRHPHGEHGGVDFWPPFPPSFARNVSPPLPACLPASFSSRWSQFHEVPGTRFLLTWARYLLSTNGEGPFYMKWRLRKSVKSR